MTDESVVGKPPRKGDFPYLRQGVIRAGDLLLSYTIFMYSKNPDPVSKLESIFMNAQHINAGKEKFTTTRRE